MPDIYDLAQTFRASLISRERASAVRLVKAYGKAWNRLKKQLDQLTQQIQEARARGDLVSPAWLLRQERYASLLAQVSREIAGFADLAGREITREQRAAVNAALRDSQRLLLTAMETAPGIEATFNQLPKAAVENMIGFLGDGSPLKTLLDPLPRQGNQIVQQGLIDGVALGRNPKAIAREIRKGLGGNLVRALTISRTEVLRAYREASHRTYNQNQDVLDGWIWLAAKSARTCAACLALDGTFHPVTERMKSHVNCIPRGAIVYASEVQASTARWYEGELIEFVTIGGYRLAVTPNHPILTAKGWIAAGLLNKGDNVVSARLPERVLAAINPNKDYIPARIEQVVSTFTEGRSVLSVSVPTAPEDFHGDGEGSQVQIVSVNSLLGNSINAPFFQPLRHQQFRGADMSCPDLTSSGPFDFLFDRLFAMSYGSMRSFSVPQIFFRCPHGHHQPIGFKNGASLDTVFSQYTNDRRARYIQTISDGVFGLTGYIARDNGFFRQAKSVIVAHRDAIFHQQATDNLISHSESAAQFCARFAGLVQLDQIREISKYPFSGHVYNLQTHTGWYISNNIIAHNCRCTQVPGVKGQTLEFQRGADWFAKQSADIQKTILGSEEAYQAFKSGKLKLEDFVGLKRSIQWGDSYYALSGKRALAGEGQFPVGIPRREIPIPREPQPAGIPVDRGLKLPARGELADVGKRTLAAIEKIHGDGELPQIPVQPDQSKKRFGGYWYETRDPLRAVKITVRKGEANHPELTLAHEIGHFIDQQGAGRARHYASVDDGRFAEFRTVVKNSQAVTRLRELWDMRAIEVTLPNRTTARYDVDRNFIDYLLRPQELWARAYAQYITTRSGDLKMIEQLKQLRSRVGQIYYPKQWDDDDFAPIAEAIDRLMIELKWRQ